MGRSLEDESWGGYEARIGEWGQEWGAKIARCNDITSLIEQMFSVMTTIKTKLRNSMAVPMVGLI